MQCGRSPSSHDDESYRVGEANIQVEVNGQHSPERDLRQSQSKTPCESGQKIISALSRRRIGFRIVIAKEIQCVVKYHSLYYTHDDLVAHTLKALLR